MRTMLFPPRLTASAESVREAAHRRGLRTTQFTSLTLPDGRRGAEHLHAGPRFADVVAPAYGIAPLEAPRDWLAGLPWELTRRDVRIMPIAEAYALRRPVFVKSPNDKEIQAMVYADGSRLPGPDAVDRDTPVLVSDTVKFTAEYRLHCLDGKVHTGSRYAEGGRMALGPLSDAARAFGDDVLAEAGTALPSAIVVDVGMVDGYWAVVEANAAWASGLYTASPDRALDVILRAAGPLGDVAPRDRQFIRTPEPRGRGDAVTAEELRALFARMPGIQRPAHT
ncbi:ATP-grasp domain-containing protein [Streptomyces roseifaciens]|uniref:ATP-grasp domain-containing protein n=1 Tax=Streptomyces roseifaciens TaxID=1488406 RepID=UPI0009A061D1|nr:ATP-grasp domain-containing protein [Streptomyces roseifaciens]